MRGRAPATLQWWPDRRTRLPTARRLWRAHLFDSRRMHPALRAEPFGQAGISLRPDAAPSPWSETLAEGVLISAAGLPVDPAVAERLLQRHGVRQAGRAHRALLGQHHKSPIRVGVVLLQPDLPRFDIANRELGRVSHDRPAWQKSARHGLSCACEGPLLDAASVRRAPARVRLHM